MDIVVRKQINQHKTPSKMYAVITQQALDAGDTSITLHPCPFPADDEAHYLKGDAYVVEINFLTKYVG